MSFFLKITVTDWFIFSKQTNYRSCVNSSCIFIKKWIQIKNNSLFTDWVSHKISIFPIFIHFVCMQSPRMVYFPWDFDIFFVEILDLLIVPVNLGDSELGLERIYDHSDNENHEFPNQISNRILKIPLFFVQMRLISG